MNALTGTIGVQNLHKQFGKNLVLKGISLDIQSGERVCIIGPSGSGKSTLLRCLNALEDATTGKIQINGYDINQDGQNINAMRATVGMVFQRFNLFPHKTVLDNVKSGPLIVKKQSNEEVEAQAIALLKRVGLLEKASAYPSSLSGGQQQRIAIARAMLQDPEILLADEPVASLDPINSEIVMQSIAALNRERNITLLINLHSVDLARRYCSRVIGMNNGKIVFDAPVEELTDLEVDRIYGATSQPRQADLAPEKELKTARPAAVRSTRRGEPQLESIA
jgi:phosphonate ABC transporter ATP-binding protein